MAKITIVRKSESMGVLRRLKILLDGKVVGWVKDGQSQTIEVPEGAHEVSVKMDWVKSNRVTVDGDAGARELVVYMGMFSFRLVDASEKATVGSESGRSMSGKLGHDGIWNACQGDPKRLLFGFLFGLGAVIYASFAFWQNWKLEQWVVTSGELVSIEERDVIRSSGKGGTWRAVVYGYEYEYFVDGAKHAGKDLFERPDDPKWTAEGAVRRQDMRGQGNPIRVHYNPKHCAESYIWRKGYWQIVIWMLLGSFLVLTSAWQSSRTLEGIVARRKTDGFQGELWADDGLCGVGIAWTCFAIIAVLICLTMCPFSSTDPIFRLKVPFYGAYICAVVGFALLIPWLAIRDGRRTNWLKREIVYVVLMLALALAVHFMCAFSAWGHGMSVPAAINGFLMRCSAFAACHVPTVLCSIVAATLAGFGRWKRFDEHLRFRSTTAGRFLGAVTRWSVLSGTLSLLLYEMLVLLTFMVCDSI